MTRMKYAAAITQALREELTRDERVILLGQDIGLYGGVFTATKGLFDEFGGQRVRDTPISEAAMIGAGVGAAMVGLRPVVEIQFADFLACGMDQLVNNAAKIHSMTGGQFSVPMVVRAATGGFLGFGAQHMQSIENWFVGTPGLKVVAPSDAADAYTLLKAAIRDPDPVLFLEHKALYSKRSPFVDVVGETDRLGVGSIKREGRHVSVIATSLMVHKAMEVASRLAEQEGIEVEVVDPRTLVPLDKALLERSVRKTGRAVVVNEGPLTGGFASEVAAVVQERCFHVMHAPVLRVAAMDTPIPASLVMEKAVLPSDEDIERAIRSILSGQGDAACELR